jgi:anti-sigma regulatory factor (Ser/Thr protein kinase)
VRVETTRTAGAVRLRHAVAFTEGFTTAADEVAARAAPFVAAARGRGEVVALAVRPAAARALAAVPPAADLLTAGLLTAGPPAAAGASPVVPLAFPDGPDRSGQTLAARWARELRAHSRGRGGVTVVVEHDPDLDGLDGGFWTELDAALNVALADVAASVLCLYPQFPLHLEVADGARRNHPLVLVDGVLRHNPEHRGAREVLTDRGGAPAPALLGPPDQRMDFDTWQLVEVRDTVARAAQAAGCDRDRVADLVLAVNEVATNAVEHGSGDAHLALWTGPGSHELLCEVHDGGRLGDPLPGLRAPHPSDPRGRGLWIARQLCDLLHVWGDDAGTHVRIRALP